VLLWSWWNKLVGSGVVVHQEEEGGSTYQYLHRYREREKKQGGNSRPELT